MSPCLGFGKRSDLGENKTLDQTRQDKHRGEILLAATKSAHLVGGTKYEVPVLAPILIHHPEHQSTRLDIKVGTPDAMHRHPNQE